MTQSTDNSTFHETLETAAKFADLGVDAAIVRALDDEGIEHPFVIQEMAIPIALTGTDLIGQARTGTGKTLAFGIPILQKVKLKGDDGFDELTNPDKPQALVMAPTRELVIQVAKDIVSASTYRAARVVSIYGGVSYDAQLTSLSNGVDIVVGTPGRLLDLVARGSLDLSQVSILVLDEADEMLDLGFLPDVEKLISQTPASRQSMLFSATMPSQIIALARAYLTQPVRVRAEGHDTQATVPDTTQFVYQAHELDKPEILGRILQAEGVEKMMVFTKTKRSAQKLADELRERGFAAASIHGDLAQIAREKALKRFRKGEIAVLVATDVAARGIDVSGVSHVVNYECPEDAKTYVHRIGRTGRAGAKGVAITLIDWTDITRWKVINKALDLHFSEPVETYSTSDHLYSDLHIAPDTKGKLKNPAPRRTRPRRERRHTRGATRPNLEETASTQQKTDLDEKSTQKRRRRRTRNGKPVRED